MPELSNEQRSARLAEYMRTISSSTNTESMLSGLEAATANLDTVNKRSLQKASDAIRKSMARDTQVTHDEISRAEAIIHKTLRPSQLIQNDWFEPFQGEFDYLTRDQTAIKALKSAIPAIGRIDLPKHPLKYGGTGFVVGKNLIMTNRHVAEIFTTGIGRQNIVIKPWQPGQVDFKKEFGLTTDGFPITHCVMIHPYWDVAIFEADLPDSIMPLRLSTQNKLDLQNRDVVVIGYPAFDPERNDADVQQEIFQGKYNVKRIAPGRIVPRKKTIGSSWLTENVDALAHDSSTLGGNSGSAVIDTAEGVVNGLHFAGLYLVENYAVPGYELARDPRIVDAGVNFAGPIPPPNKNLDSYWSSADAESPRMVSTPGSVNVPAPSGNQAQSTSKMGDGRAVEFEVPLRITVSVGDTTQSQTLTMHAPRSGMEGASASVVTGAGYNANFLSQSVPAPGLSASQLTDAVKLNQSPLLHYTHFSVCQSTSRMLPRFVAWNIDGGSLKSLSRRNIRFRRDDRIAANVQVGDELYSNNPYDRGHIARRADLIWGPLEEAKKANVDSFFFTNITPQHESFNQSEKHGLWGELENAILEDVDVENLKISVLAGPIFRDDDFEYRDVLIPRNFWKLIAFRDTADSKFKVAAYILSQSNLIPTEALELDPFKLYQVSLKKLASETGLNFDAVSQFDTAPTTEAIRGSGVRAIASRDQILA